MCTRDPEVMTYARTHSGWPGKATHCAFVLLITSALLACPGCGTSSTRTVSGKITYQGQPVTSGLINFAASDDRPLGNSIRPDGTYICQLPPGEYKVRIDAPGAIPDNWKNEGDRPPPPTRRQAPIKYSRFETSGLTAAVDADKGPLTIDFNLL